MQAAIECDFNLYNWKSFDHYVGPNKSFYRLQERQRLPDRTQILFYKVQQTINSCSKKARPFYLHR